MVHNNHSVPYAETLAALYLVLPLLIFFAFFVRLEIGVPGCALIIYQTCEIIPRTSWRETAGFNFQALYFLAIAALWVWLSAVAGLGLVLHNFDWSKHYSIINLLAQTTWPPIAQIEGRPDSVLRYYVGWYLVPSAVVKIAGAQLQPIASAAWTMIGVFLFFNLLPNLVGRRLAAVVAPLVFMVFGGADVIGMIINGKDISFGTHLEWWAGWVQYSSNTTALFWVPHHAIPAWLGVALIMRQRNSTAAVPYLALIASAILLWSPFAAVGLAPFLLLLARLHGLRPILLDWRPIASILLLAAPIALYFSANAVAIPARFVLTSPCNEFGACFTWSSYLLFLLIEVGAPLLILLLWRSKEKGVLIAAAITLCVIPFYAVGAGNDFAMRSSLPSLAVLAILCTKALLETPKRLAVAMVIAVLIMLPTCFSEFYRGFRPGPGIDPDKTFSADDNKVWGPSFLDQYLAPLPVWILRQ
jgi:hypothetical protein